MSFDGSRPPHRRGIARGVNHVVRRVLRSLRQGLGAWRTTHRTTLHADAVVIGTLRRPRLAIAMRAAVVPTEPTPPPLAVFLERMIAEPLSPYCPRCSLPLERWHGDAGVAGQPLGYECRPCGTRTRWTPADVLKQMKREVRRHYVHYWAQYREAIRARECGGSRAGVSGHHGRGGAR
jgi:tRNA(Ile2) C34 agmatinyltransferase TiaS